VSQVIPVVNEKNHVNTFVSPLSIFLTALHFTILRMLAHVPSSTYFVQLELLLTHGPRIIGNTWGFIATWDEKKKKKKTSIFKKKKKKEKHIGSGRPPHFGHGAIPRAKSPFLF
jgi:hypothetical protein